MIVISGASRGLGKAIYEDLKNKGQNVIGLSRKENKDLNIFQCNVSDYDSIKEAVKNIKKIDNKIFAFINCAGIASMNLALATPKEATNKIVGINLMGTIFTNQIFAPMIIRNGGGRIINFSSLAVHLGIKGESVYIASKAGVESFSRSLARELSPFNITVNCIAPGPIKTDLLRGVTNNQISTIVNQQIIQKICDETDVVNQVNLLLDEKSDKLTGQVISVGGR